MNQNKFQGANYRAPMDDINEIIMWEPKIVQCIAAFNEQDFIWYTLKSIYDEVDYIRVVEGAVGNRKDADKDGHSTDETVNIINEFIKNEDPHKKVHLIQRDGPFKSLEEQKQTFLNYAVRGEWIYICDSDEFVHKGVISLLRKAIELYPTASEFIPLFFHHYADFQTVAKPNNENAPQHQRFFRFVPGMSYHTRGHPIVSDELGHDTFFSQHYQHRRYIVKGFNIHHMGYARPNMDKIMRDKQEYYKTELSKHESANLKFDEKVRVWLNREEKDEDFCYFPKDQLPEILRKHPMFDYIDERWEGRSLQNWQDVEPYNLDNIPNIWLYMSGLNPRMKYYSNQITLKELKNEVS